MARKRGSQATQGPVSARKKSKLSQKRLQFMRGQGPNVNSENSLENSEPARLNKSDLRTDKEKEALVL